MKIKSKASAIKNGFLVLAFMGGSLLCVACSSEGDEAAVRQTQAQQQSTVIATKDGIHLTQAHLDAAFKIDVAFSAKSHLTPAERKELKDLTIAEFLQDPQATLDSLNEMIAEVDSMAEVETQASLPKTTGVSAGGSGVVSNGNVAQGHLQLRQALRVMNQNSGTNARFSDNSFGGVNVNQLRTFIAGSQLSSSSYNAHGSGQRTFTMCSNGTFRYYYGSLSSVSPSVGGGEVTGISEASATGYWDAYQEGGNIALLLFSSDAGFLDETINNTGLLPMPIAAYQHDAVQLGQRGQAPTPDMLLARTEHAGCW